MRIARTEWAHWSPLSRMLTAQLVGLSSASALKNRASNSDGSVFSPPPPPPLPRRRLACSPGFSSCRSFVLKSLLTYRHDCRWFIPAQLSLRLMSSIESSAVLWTASKCLMAEEGHHSPPLYIRSCSIKRHLAAPVDSLRGK